MLEARGIYERGQQSKGITKDAYCGDLRDASILADEEAGVTTRRFC
ncbi:MAG: hypothetical protein HS132_09830 [Planctomycetia bacterium]|nr:hypothetical protein [Planctomycetia bacterium]